MDNIRQRGERWIYFRGNRHFLCEVLDSYRCKVLYLFPDHTEGTRRIGDIIEYPSWQSEDVAFTSGFWQHLSGQQAPQKGST